MKYILTLFVSFIIIQQFSTEQCQGTTTQGKRCSRITPKNISYCWEHSNGTSITTEEDEPVYTVRIMYRNDSGEIIEDDCLSADFVPVEKNPVPVKQIAPDYPEIARRAGVEGTVWVSVCVDKEGKVKRARISKSDAEIFNQPSIEAAMKWVFTPAIMNNSPVEVRVSVPFKFTLLK